MRQKGFAPIIILLSLILVGVLGYIAYTTNRNANTETTNKTPEPAATQQTTIPVPIKTPAFLPTDPPMQITPTPRSVGGKTIFTDANTGLSLSYPSFINLYTTGQNIPEDNNFSLAIWIRKVDSLNSDYPLYSGNKDNAIAEMKSLENGEFGAPIDFEFDSSKKVIKIEDLNAKTYVLFGRFDTCSIAFERTLRFYSNGYQIEITLAGPPDEITNSMPQYFEDYGGSTCWKADSDPHSMAAFYKSLVNRSASEVTLKWYDTFDSIINSIKLSSN